MEKVSISEYRSSQYLLSLKASKRSAIWKIRLKLLFGSHVGRGRISHSTPWYVMYCSRPNTVSRTALYCNMRLMGTDGLRFSRGMKLQKEWMEKGKETR